jgi:raffinose/stachyose/melibiose transport system substrate-binding protein
VTSLAKQGPVLFAFEPEVGMEGMFTNNDLFRKLGFKVPQTFSQFLDLCRKARTAGTVAFMLAGASPPTMAYLLTDLAVPTVYAKDKLWAQKLRGGKVSFDGSSGWHKALQELLDMNNANCFEPGVTGTTTAGAQAQFAQGQGLMIPGLTSQMGQIAADSPQFTLSAHPFPGGGEPTQTRAFLNLDPAVSVNAHASLQNQAAARSFIDFVARPKQNALFAQVQGGLTQYQFLKEQLPTFLLDYASVFKERKYVVNPISGWWNPNVFLTLEQDGVGLLTGQLSVDDVLSAMDAAWKKGPA